MLTLEEVLLISGERVALCRGEVELDLFELFERYENAGFSRKEIIVAISELICEEFKSLPDMPRLH